MGQSATIFDSEDDTQQSDIFSTADQEVPNFPVSTDHPSPEVDPVPSSRCSVCVSAGRPKRGLASAAEREELNRIRQTLSETGRPPRRNSSVIIDRFDCIQELRPGRLATCKRPESTSFFDPPTHPTLEQAPRKKIIRRRPAGVTQTDIPTLIAHPSRPAIPKITLVKNKGLNTWSIKGDN